MIAAGMLMCACVVSTARYVPSTRSPYTLYFTVSAAAVRGHRPAVRIGARRRQLAAAWIEDVDVVDVLREVVQRVAARRRSAHPQLERRLIEIVEIDLHLHPAVLRLGKREAVLDRFGGKGGVGSEQDRERQAAEPHGNSIV